MKLLLVITSLVLVINATTDQELWNQFKQKHGKTYRSLKEEKLRFNIFQESLRKIEAHNALYESGEKTYYISVTQFADLTPEEFKSQYLTLGQPSVTTANKFVKNPTLKVEDSINWVERGAVLEVKSQGKCGGCWAFAATGALEGQNAIKHGIKVSLSEQELLDCSKGYGNIGCNGGIMEWAFDYAKDHGISAEGDYPYIAYESICYQTKKVNITVTGYTEVDTDEDSLKEAVATIGPISVGINAETIGYYGGGIFNEPECSNERNHGVLVVGYGNEDGLDYWLIKNSWGDDWGEDGYFKLARNQNQQCGISTQSVYPIIN